MSIEGWQLFAVFVAAHALADFCLQPDWLYSRKKDLRYLSLHGLVHSLLVAACIDFEGRWTIAVAIVFVTHVGVDALKLRFGGQSARAFVFDQVAHLLVLFVLAHELVRLTTLRCVVPAAYVPALAGAAGFVFAVFAGRYLIGLAIRDFEAARPEKQPGLPQAGRIIGQLERGLVFLLVLCDEAGAIGFLVAAKSVFRFGDLKAADERKESEYVIIGTLMSFGFATLVAFATRALLARL